MIGTVVVDDYTPPLLPNRVQETPLAFPTFCIR